MKERTTDGKTGIDCAEKYKSGNLGEIRTGYSGKTAPNGSLINGVEKIFDNERLVKSSPFKIQRSFPLKKGEPAFQDNIRYASEEDL